jgi:hypothetical protein
MRVFLIVTLLAVLVVPASALAADRPHRENPYASLFTGQLGSEQTPSVPKPPAPSLPFVQLPNLVQPATPQYSLPAVVMKCGMTIYPGDASIDPKILIPRAPTSTIKTIPAPACVK